MSRNGTVDAGGGGHLENPGFNQFGDLERCRLRPGSVHSAEDWHLVLDPVMARYRERGVDLYFRADAAFAKPEIY